MALEYLTVEHLTTKDLIRIFSKIEIHPDVSFNGTPCWTWRGAQDKDGYGIIRRFNKLLKLHRWIFAWLVHSLIIGDQQAGLDHLCRQRQCCNPIHLEFVPNGVNVLRGEGPAVQNKRKTHCIRGHLLDGENLSIDARGMRQCRICMRFRDRRQKQRVKLKSSSVS